MATSEPGFTGGRRPLIAFCVLLQKQVDNQVELATFRRLAG